MKVLVDTSCWIQAFQNQTSFEAQVIATLLEENIVVTSSLVLAELLRGANNSKELSFLKNEFKAIPLISGIDELGAKIGELGFRLRKQGYTLATFDLTLAVLALSNQAHVYSLDRHFKLIARHSPLKLFEPLKH